MWKLEIQLKLWKRKNLVYSQDVTPHTMNLLKRLTKSGRNIILFIFIILTVHLNMSARGSGEKPSIVVSVHLHQTLRKAGRNRPILIIENKFGKEGFTVKAIPLQIPGIRTMEGFQEKRTMILERVPVPPTLVVCMEIPLGLSPTRCLTRNGKIFPLSSATPEIYVPERRVPDRPR